MFRLSLLRRLLTIQRILVRHRLDDVISATRLFPALSWLFRLLPRGKQGPLGFRLRRALEDLGPIFVKFGQAVSTRRDLLPIEVADELAKLQDQVPPFDSKVAMAHVGEVFGQPVSEVFKRFDEQPLAAASIAQVHTAQLHSGEEVIVKVLRPNMRPIIQRDLEVLHALAELADRYWVEGKRLRPKEVVTEYEKTILNELDLLREAANAAQLRRNFEGSEKLYVPDVHWDYCRPSVLTMERISGVPISDVETLRSKGTNIRRLAEHGVEIFFTQVFVHNFFHADMHPGNIFVDVSDPEYPRYVAVDFGIVGSLTARNQHYLAENFLAFFNRDYYRVAKLHVDSGWVPPDTRVDELEAAVRAVCEPIFNKPLKDISFGLVLLRLFETARRFNMEVQPQLVLLQKTLLNIEGLGRQLYPELDLWTTAKPILEDWVARKMDPSVQLKNLSARLPDLLQDAQLLPDRLQALLRQLAEGRIELSIKDPESDRLRQELQSLRRQQRRSWLGAVLALSGTLWLLIPEQPSHWPWLLVAIGGFLLCWPTGRIPRL